MTDEAGQLGSIADGAGVVEAGAVAASPKGDGMALPIETENLVQRRKSPWRRRMALAGAAVALIAAGVVLPPLVNIGRYQRQVTSLMTRAMGRPVRLSEVELRLLPWPGFVIHDLAVSEDPGFGAEPILSARTVVASVAILPLWRGRLEISRVSVDEASLNLVRNGEGRWNLETLMMGAGPALGVGAAGASGKPAGRKPVRFPYLEATNSRVNLKNGAEKTPFSLVDTDLSLWQDEPGAWRVRLRGHPVRTDLEMSLGDTGEMRLEASLRSAAQLRDMPLKLEMEWRDAQLGQLSRLLTGSDAGWRGEVRADIAVLGSLESAQTTARLRATGVRREEFAPDTPLDFDANCGFLYRRSQNAFHQVSCETALGNGRLHLAADLPGNAGAPEGMLEVQQVPLQAGLDLLRTVRGGFAPGISVKGVANGSLTYKVAAEAGEGVSARKVVGKSLARARKSGAVAVPGDLTGTITVDEATLTGGELKDDLVLPKMVWTPEFLTGAVGKVAGLDSVPTPETGLGTRFTVAMAEGKTARVRNTAAAKAVDGGADGAGAASGVGVALVLGAHGFEARLDGNATIARLRGLAYAFGMEHLDAADQLTSGEAGVHLAAAGPWIAGDAALVPAEKTGPAVEDGVGALTGSVELPHAEWKPPYLARPVELSSGTVTVADGGVVVQTDFAIGPAKTALKGTATAKARLACVGTDCRPEVQLQFGAVDASEAEAALLAAPEEKSLLSPLMDEVARMRSSGATAWPDVRLSAKAESVVLGPTTLRDVTLVLRGDGTEAAIESWQGDVLGGSGQGQGRIRWVAGLPEYSIEGSFREVKPGLAGGLIEGLAPGMAEARWTGKPISGEGKVTLSGLTAKELAGSAAGELRFDWPGGVVGTVGTGLKPVRFDRWSGVAAIRGGSLVLGSNAMQVGRRRSAMTGTLTFGKPITLAVAGAGEAQTGRAPTLQ